MFVSTMAFHFPIFAIGPEKMAPIAAPKVQALVIIVDHLFSSSLFFVLPYTGTDHPNKAAKGSCRVLKTPIE